MMPLNEFSAAARARIRFVLTDMDETLTFKGRLSADAYAALERLQEAGIVVVPVTAAPAGWCDLIVRQWPVDAVIGENGGFCFSLDRGTRAVRRDFWRSAEERARDMSRLETIGERILAAIPGARTASDQPFRQTTWAIELQGDAEPRARRAGQVAAAWREAGAQTTINSLWVLGWFGGFDKLSMSLRVGREHFSVDLSVESDAVVYVGDSLNDEPMFRYFANSVGVATVADDLDRMDSPPRWITKGPGGAGFVEVANAILARS